ncbi:Tim44 domain-containing protein [Pseudomaricurvus sp. HS19]|nr:Tim44 domain-containing protein [Pseudomaricurvus sp. HS19]
MSKKLSFLALTTAAIFLIADPALAGPGGKIASAAFETVWGKIILAVLFVVFMPLIVSVLWREKVAERRARKDLRFMSTYSPNFEWLRVQGRAVECFYRVHSGWGTEDLSDTSGWMTDWYWQNQQLAHLDRWQKAGLQNICNVKKITNIKPLLFVHRNQGAEHEDSMVVISISATMQDYLQDRRTGKIVEGSKRYKDVETVWSFTLEDGQWKVAAIEESSMSLAYAKLVKELPDIETTASMSPRARR